MNKGHTIFLMLFVSIFNSLSLFSQPTYDLQFRLEQNDAVVSGIYEVTAQIKANLGNFQMGSSNLVFAYDTLSLSSPAPIGPGPDSLQLQSIHNYSGGNYNKMTLTEPVTGRMSLNIELFDPDSGATVPMSFVDIATIRFTIIDPNIAPALTWRIASPNPLTIFSDDEITIVDANALAAEVLLADLKVFLEGPYSGGSMSTTLNAGGYLPLSQPFNTSPWNYSGPESVTGIPAEIVDWVLVQLRSDETTVVADRAGFITSDGLIVDLNGTSPITFDVLDNNYYFVVNHRNHLSIMSASQIPLNKASSENPYDFTSGQSQAYGTDPLKEFGSGSGVYGMIGGDSNHDGNITVADNNLIILERNTEGYRDEDINMDGNVTIADNNQTMNNRNRSTQVPASSDKGNKKRSPRVTTKNLKKDQID